VVREAFARAEGYEVDYEGDAFFYAFASAQAAVEAVKEAIAGLGAGRSGSGWGSTRVSRGWIRRSTWGGMCIWRRGS
jgi:hypothetical protein